MRRSIYRPAPDGLSREYWEFTLTLFAGSMDLTLTHYGVQRRITKRGSFRGAEAKERWSRDDERRYTSGLPRPVSVPEDVLAEVLQVPVRYYIAFANEECWQKDLTT